MLLRPRVNGLTNTLVSLEQRFLSATNLGTWNLSGLEAGLEAEEAQAFR
jgi:hypothetical protein